MTSGAGRASQASDPDEVTRSLGRSERLCLRQCSGMSPEAMLS